MSAPIRFKISHLHGIKRYAIIKKNWKAYMILIDDDHIWEIDDETVHRLLATHMQFPKETLTVKHKGILNQILDRFRRRPEVPALLKPKKGH